jgi:hypothetical protein
LVLSDEWSPESQAALQEALKKYPASLVPKEMNAK